MRPAPLPPGTPRAFTVSAALSHGISRTRLRAKDLSSPFYATRSREELGRHARLSLLLSALPDHAFACGITAAALWGLPLSLADEQAAWEHPRIGVPEGETRIRRPGVTGARLQIDEDDLVHAAGLRTLSVPRAWVDVSRSLGLGRLVALTDAALSRRHPPTTREELEAVSRRFAGGRGAKARHRALELCDAAAESPRESMVRVILVEAGLPRPQCNVDVLDGDRFVARVDMLYPDARLIVEYDGDYHRDADQWSRDQIRRAELESLGYRVTVVTRRDFDDPSALVARIRRLLGAR